MVLAPVWVRVSPGVKSKKAIQFKFRFTQQAHWQLSIQSPFDPVNFKGPSRIGQYRKRLLRNYLLYFICSDDKIKPEKLFQLYCPIFGDLTCSR